MQLPLEMSNVERQAAGRGNLQPSHACKGGHWTSAVIEQSQLIAAGQRVKNCSRVSVSCRSPSQGVAEGHRHVKVLRAVCSDPASRHRGVCRVRVRVRARVRVRVEVRLGIGLLIKLSSLTSRSLTIRAPRRLSMAGSFSTVCQCEGPGRQSSERLRYSRLLDSWLVTGAMSPLGPASNLACGGGDRQDISGGGETSSSR